MKNKFVTFTPFMWALPLSFETNTHGVYIQFLCFSFIIGEPF